MYTMCIKFFFLILCFVAASTVHHNLKLQRVIVLSRHNVRTPLANDLADISPKPWPEWSEKSGYLTAKGAYLEGLMGYFFSVWLKHEGLLPEGCPENEDVFVYANSKQRTKASAHAFVRKAFPGCNITVNVNDKTDPIFNPVIHNDTEIFKELALEQMQSVLHSLCFNTSYEFIENILDYKDSNLCKKNSQCDLVTDINKIKGFVVGQKPFISGPLKISKGAVDAFVMQYYNGLSLPDVAWGELRNKDDWKTVMKLSKGYHDVIFNTTLLARDIAHPLISYMKNIFMNKYTKFTLLMGHDANIFTILSGLRFRPYDLPKQYEKSPIGGKIVFQKWLNNETGIYSLRINFVYASTRQLRDGLMLDLTKPPQFQILELEGCSIDNDGFCPWEVFLRVLDDF